MALDRWVRAIIPSPIAGASPPRHRSIPAIAPIANFFGTHDWCWDADPRWPGTPMAWAKSGLIGQGRQPQANGGAKAPLAGHYLEQPAIEVLS